MDQKINILPFIIAFYRDNDLKLKFVRAKKSWHINQGSQCQKYGIKAKQISAYIWGHPVIQAVDAKMLGPFYKIFRPWKNQPCLSTIWAEIIGGAIITPPPPGPCRPGSLRVNCDKMLWHLIKSLTSCRNKRSTFIVVESNLTLKLTEDK